MTVDLRGSNIDLAKYITRRDYKALGDSQDGASAKKKLRLLVRSIAEEQNLGEEQVCRDFYWWYAMTKFGDDRSPLKRLLGPLLFP